MVMMTRRGLSARCFLADRLDRLQRTIDELGWRLREGLARAIGGAVSEAVHAAVRGLLTGAPLPAGPPDDPLLEPSYDPYAPGLDAPYAPLSDDPYDDEWRPEEPHPRRPAPEPALPRLPWRLAAAAALQGLAAWLRYRDLRKVAVAALGVAAATGGAAAAAGPLVAGGAAVVGALLSLLAATDGAQSWLARLAQAVPA